MFGAEGVVIGATAGPYDEVEVQGLEAIRPHNPVGGEPVVWRPNPFGVKTEPSSCPSSSAIAGRSIGQS